MKIDPELLAPNENLTIREGALSSLNIGNIQSWYFSCLAAVAREYGFSLDVPFKELSAEARRVIFFGIGEQKVKVEYSHDNGNVRTYMGSWEGLVNNYERRHKETNSNYIREELEKYMSFKPCPVCGGARLKKESLAVTVGERNIYEISNFSIREAMDFFAALTLSEREGLIARQILKEIKARLSFLVNVGLDYITLSRSAGTLSGGEAQRIRLATQIGSGLTGVLYILDEPSIGLHQRDNRKLIEALKGLRDLGNTVIVVEHDEETMEASDYIIDIGPGAGIHGGELVAEGPPALFKQHETSVTARYLSGRSSIPLPDKRRLRNGKSITIKGAHKHNLHNLDVEIPLGVFVAVTGVSGSGKSTLINDILYHTLAYRLHREPLYAPGFRFYRRH